MKIFIDDGSTNIKICLLDGENASEPGTALTGWFFSLLDDAAPAMLKIDGEKFFN
ncbi:plasmid segregation protein ParM domain-containing protein [Escherichia coli]